MALRDTDARGAGEDQAAIPPDAEAGGEGLPAAADRIPAAGAPQGNAPAAPAPKPKRLRKLLLLAVLAGALGYGGYEARNYWTDGRFVVSTDDAYVQADITILAAKVAGYVASVEVANNQTVKAGDVIARLDDGDYRLAVQSAKDKLATQQATIARIGRQADAARAQVGQAEAQVTAARADAERAAAEYQRQTQLAQSDYTTRSRLEQSKADRDRSEAAVQSTEAALLAARTNVDVLAAQQGEAERVAAEIRTLIEKAEHDLAYTVIRAPVDGVVGNKAVEVGTYVQPGARLAALVPLGSAHVDANFKETQLGDIHVGQKVRIAVDALPDHAIEGWVESIAPASGAVFSLLPAENATGNFTKIVQRVPVRIALPSEVARQGGLRAGLSVVVEVDTRDLGEVATTGSVAPGPGRPGPAPVDAAPASERSVVAPAAPATPPPEFAGSAPASDAHPAPTRPAPPATRAAEAPPAGAVPPDQTAPRKPTPAKVRQSAH